MIARAGPRPSKTARLSAANASSARSAGLTSPHAVARLVPLDPGFYAFSLATETDWREPVTGLPLPAVHLCAPPRRDGEIEITDGFGRIGSWLGVRHKVLFVKSPTGGAALVTGYLPRDPDSEPLALDIQRLEPSDAAATPAKDAEEGPSMGTAPMSLAPFMRLKISDPAAAERSPQPIALDVLAHIHGRGDVHFVDTPVIGRLGRGLWIEGFAIFPESQSARTTIEYKGLTASGTETPWIRSGMHCGTQGSGIPLIGFAVRQKAVIDDAAFDCEYTGYFQSGATVGPTRNGAPCRSAVAQDALEGVELRITPRPTHRAKTQRA